MKTNVLKVVAILASAIACHASALAADPRLGLRHYVGEGVGFEDSFTSFEWFQPLYDTQVDTTFMDFHPIIDNRGHYAQNLGLGYRNYLPNADRVFGIFGYYDLREASDNEIVGEDEMFHQVSLGVDTIGKHWDFRSNIYMPFEQEEEPVLPGFDMEFGLALPVPFDAHGYVGWYGFEENENDTVFGIRGRVEGKVTDNVTLGLELNDDALFGTTLNFRVAWYFRGFKPYLGFGCGDACHGTAYQRLATPVERNYLIAMQPREFGRDD